MLDRISRLTPTQFENLTYDCVKAAGLKNVVWRTPGSDGGRDIEGMAFVRDLSGQELVQKWYVECKLYSSAVDWPTVWKKIAHADAENADVLLIASNSNPSPMCESKIEKWNTDRKLPIIRFWRGYNFSSMLSYNKRIALCYGLIDGQEAIDAAVLPLSLLISKTTQSAYLENSFGGNASPMLEASAALAELLSKRLDDLRGYGAFKPLADAGQSIGYDWLTQDGSSAAWEGAGLRAVLAFARHILRPASASIAINDASATISFEDNKFPLNGKGSDDLNMVAGWSNLYLSFNENTSLIGIGRIT